MRIIARMNVGGPAVEVHNLMSGLDKNHFEQLLVTGYCENDEIDYLTANNLNIPLVRIKDFGRSVRFIVDLRVFLALRKLMKIYKPHVIHTHTAKAGFLGRIASISISRCHIRVHTYHGHLLSGYFSKTKTRLIIFVERILAQYTHTLISVGKSVRDELVENKIGNSEKFKVIMPGRNFDGFFMESSKKLNAQLNRGVFRVCWIGRFAQIKRPDRLLEIASLASTEDCNIKFLAVGDGHLLQKTKHIAKVEKLPIDFLGWQTNISEILRSCDALVLTSENEGTPIVLMESQFAGVPVIATDVGSVNEVILNGKTGFVSEYSAEIFLGHIKQLKSDNNLWFEMSVAGAQFARKSFTIEEFLQKHADLYRSLMI